MSNLPRTGALLASSLVFSTLALAQDSTTPDLTGHIPTDVHIDEGTGAIRVGAVQLAQAYATVEALQLEGATVAVAVRERVQQTGPERRRRVLEIIIETRAEAAVEALDRAVLTFDAVSLEAVMPGELAEESEGVPLYWTQGRTQGPPEHARNARSASGRRHTAPHSVPLYWASAHAGPVYWSSTPLYWNAERMAPTPLYWNEEAPVREQSGRGRERLTVIPYDRTAE